MAQPAVNYTPLTPLSFLVRSAYVFPDKTAVVYKDTRYTYRQLRQRVNRCATALQAAGVTPGDRVACVHSYWLLSRVSRLHPALPVSATIRRVIDQHFTASNVAGELDYLKGPAHRSFERPYGMAWLLMLAADLARHTSAEGRRWFDVLSPLATECAARLRTYVEAASYPVRAGIHNNSAFALALGFEYADVCNDEPLAEVLRQKCRSWFGNDANCPAWEPDGEDFLSPALTEALCMSRTLVATEFSI